MAQFCYDVVPHDGGWAILIAPAGNDATSARADTFPTKQAAFDAAAELAHKLRFTGLALNIRTHDAGAAAHEPPRSRRAG